MHPFSSFFFAAFLAAVICFSAAAFFVASDTFMIAGSAFAMSAVQSAIAGAAKANMNTAATTDATILPNIFSSLASALRHQPPTLDKQRLDGRLALCARSRRAFFLGQKMSLA